MRVVVGLVLMAACGRIGFDSTIALEEDAPACSVEVIAPTGGINTTSSASFIASGGVPPYRYDVLAGPGTIDRDTGLYRAPSVVGSVTIGVTDDLGCTATLDAEVGGSSLWFVGGREGAISSDQVFRSDDGGATWSLAGALPAPRSEPGAAVLDDRLWVVGGVDGGAGHRNVWSTGDGATWRIEPDFPSAVAGHWLVAYRERLWRIGGTDEAQFSTDGQTWTLAGTLPSPRHETVALIHDDMLWYIGGHDGGAMFFTDVLSSTDGATWNLVGSITGGREDAGIVVHGGKLHVMGGYDGVGYPADVQVSEDGVTWTLLPPMPSGRAYGDIVSFRGAMVYVGGTTEVWRSPDGTSWTTIGALPRPLQAGRLVAFSPR